MTGRRTNIAVAVLTAVAALVAEFGQVGCHASCFAAAIGKSAPCPLACCSQSHGAKAHCCSEPEFSPNRCDENCPQCPICRAPTRAITSSKAVLVIPVNVSWDLPPNLVPASTQSAFARIDFRIYKVIAAQHPALQILNCVWRN